MYSSQPIAALLVRKAELWLAERCTFSYTLRNFDGNRAVVRTLSFKPLIELPEFIIVMQLPTDSLWPLRRSWWASLGNATKVKFWNWARFQVGLGSSRSIHPVVGCHLQISRRDQHWWAPLGALIKRIRYIFSKIFLLLWLFIPNWNQFDLKVVGKFEKLR